jgi:spermidine synthase
MCTQPCYFGGPFALNWASDDGDHQDISAKKLARRAEKRGILTKYWTPAVHVAAFALPAYAAKVVAAAMSGEGPDESGGSKAQKTRRGRRKNKPAAAGKTE